MDIRVSGHQVDTGSALQEHASDRLETIVDKHFSRALSSTVTFGKAPASGFAADIVLHVNHGLILKSHGQAQDAHLAFDQAAEKIEKQLRRYKRRLKDRHEQAAHAAVAEKVHVVDRVRPGEHARDQRHHLRPGVRAPVRRDGQPRLGELVEARGTGEAEHRDNVLSDIERDQAGLMCLCVSRAKGDGLVIDL